MRLVISQSCSRHMVLPCPPPLVHFYRIPSLALAPKGFSVIEEKEQGSLNRKIVPTLTQKNGGCTGAASLWLASPACSGKQFIRQPYEDEGRRISTPLCFSANSFWNLHCKRHGSSLFPEAKHCNYRGISHKVIYHLPRRTPDPAPSTVLGSDSSACFFSGLNKS